MDARVKVNPMSNRREFIAFAGLGLTAAALFGWRGTRADAAPAENFPYRLTDTE